MTYRPVHSPRPLTPTEITQLDLVEAIMRAPLDQAVTIAVGRAATCWTVMPSSLFDGLTADQIVNALLARLSAELAVGAAEARGEDTARALIPTIPFPTEARDRQQCPEVVRIKGHAMHSQCLLLEGHPGDEHQNGDLRWRKNPAGEITDWWWDTAVYQTVGLGDLIRSQGITMQLPHLPADAVAPLEAEPDITARITYKSSTAGIELTPKAEESPDADKP